MALVTALYLVLGFAVLSLLYFRASKYVINKDSPLNAGVWLLYWIRLKFCILKIKFLQRSVPKRLDDFHERKLSYESCGIVPSPSEVDIETPKLLLTDRHEDGIFIWGGDDKGKIVTARVVRLSRRRASVSFMVQDGNGSIYTLPNQPDSNFVNIANEHSWIGGGLFLECVEPMRTWRLKFNGLLRCNTREDYITDAHDDKDHGSDGELIHAKVDFLWKALKAPVDVWRDHSPSLLADALIREGTCRVSLLSSLDRDGYDQWGALHGTVHFENAIHQTWYLRGIRQHRWGMSDSSTNLRRSINLYSYFSNGDFLWIEGFSYKHVITHCLMGYVMTADGSYHPITWADLEMSKIQGDETPKNIFVQVKAGGTLYNVWHHLRKGMTVHTGDPWTLKHHLFSSYTATKNREGWGAVAFTQRYKGLCPVPERRLFPVLSPPEYISAGKYVLKFSDMDSFSSSLSGGKGASLSFLTHLCGKEMKNEFLVAKGVIVTSTAWKRQQEESAYLRSTIVGLEKAVTSAIGKKIKEACEKIVSVIESQTLNKDIVDALTKSLEDTFPNSFKTKRFAVRSSACGEDSEEASSAGQNATYLGVSWRENQVDGEKGVLKALLSCWASQFSYQSVEYRRQRGQPLNEGMAVVIQEMVPADLAGVVFTRDPVTGSPAFITITCNYGLGESVVSSLADPDTYTVKRSWRNTLKIHKKTVGEKKLKIVMNETGGTSEVAVASNNKSSFCMEDPLILKLSKVAILIEEAFGSPRDIEFAVKSGEIYLLQSRPITSMYEWTDYEIQHEMDTAVLSDKEIYTINNSGEVFPGYTTPLTISVVSKMLDVAVQKDFCRRLWPSYKFDPSSNKSMVSFSSHCFLNLGEVYYRVSAEEKINTIIKVIDLSIGGYNFTTQEIHKWVVSRYGIMPQYRQMIRAMNTVYEMLFNPRKIKKLKSIYSSYDIGKDRANTAKALYKEICRKLPDLYKISESHVFMSAASSMTQCTALIILTENNKEIDDQMIQDMSSLLSCFGDTESGDVPNALKRVAKTLASAEEIEEFLSMTPDEGRVWLESHPDTVGRVFAAFIEKHGHRCYEELELRTLSWSLAPENLVEVLQKMVHIAPSFEAKKGQTLEETINGIKTPTKDSTKKALKFVLKFCGNAVRHRETTKSLLIRTVDAFRKAYRTLGHLLVSECRLPDADLIFYLHHREIGTLLETRSASLILKAMKRRRLGKNSDKTFPEFSFGEPKPISEDDLVDPTTEASTELKGTPVYLGVVRGTARVVKNLQEASTIKKDDILVTHSTDVGWTPYFPLLSGVITEIGGLISHGAVVAREYGLPCLVGVKGATRILSSGDEIILDGKAGVIKKVAKPIPEGKK